MNGLRKAGYLRLNAAVKSRSGRHFLFQHIRVAAGILLSGLRVEWPQLITRAVGNTSANNDVAATTVKTSIMLTEWYEPHPYFASNPYPRYLLTGRALFSNSEILH